MWCVVAGLVWSRAAVARRSSPPSTSANVLRPKAAGLQQFRSARPNAANVFKSAFNKPVPVRQGGRTQNMPTCEAIIRSLVGKAVQGDTRSHTAVMEIIEMIGRTNDITDEQREKTAMHLSAPFSMEQWICWRAIAVGTSITGRPPGRRRRSPAPGSHRT